jgi:hypothetical protein
MSRRQALLLLIAVGGLMNMACLSMFFAEEISQQRNDARAFAEGIGHLLYIGSDMPAADLYPLLLAQPGPQTPAEVEALVNNAYDTVAAVALNYGAMQGAAAPLPAPPAEPLNEGQPTPTPVFVAGEPVALGDGSLQVPMQYRTSLSDPYGAGSGQAQTAYCLHLVPQGEGYAWSGAIESGEYAESAHARYGPHAPYQECQSGIQPTPTPPPPPPSDFPTPVPGEDRLMGWPTNGWVSAEYGCYGVNNGVFNPSCPAHIPFWHNGIDIAAAQGSPFFNVIPGPTQILHVSDAGGCSPGEGDGRYWGYGRYIESASMTGYWRTLGAHLSNNSMVAPGQWVGNVQIGQTGGAQGSPGAGCSTGAHLHFTVWRNNAVINPREALP